MPADLRAANGQKSFGPEVSFEEVEPQASMIGNIATGLFTPVLAKHSKSFSLIDCISVGVERLQRNFEPMRKQVEAWQKSELSDVTAKVVIYDAFVIHDSDMARLAEGPVDDAADAGRLDGRAGEIGSRRDLAGTRIGAHRRNDRVVGQSLRADDVFRFRPPCLKQDLNGGES